LIKVMLLTDASKQFDRSGISLQSRSPGAKKISRYGLVQSPKVL